MTNLVVQRRWSWVVLELSSSVVISSIGLCGLGGQLIWPPPAAPPLSPLMQGLLGLVALAFLPLGAFFGWRIIRPALTQFTVAGIDQPGVSRRLLVPWREIQAVELSPTRLIVRTSQGQVTLPFRFFKDPSALLQVIAEHLPPTITMREIR